MTGSKKIVFTIWGSFGDIHPFMALARELQARLQREDGTKTACDVIERVLDDVAVGQATQQRRERVAFRRFAYDAV